MQVTDTLNGTSLADNSSQLHEDDCEQLQEAVSSCIVSHAFVAPTCARKPVSAARCHDRHDLQSQEMLMRQADTPT